MAMMTIKTLQNNILSPIRSVGFLQFFIMALLQFLLAALFIFLPLIQSIILAVIFFSAVILLMKPEWALYILVLMVPLIANYIGFYFVPTRIGAESTKTIPLFSVFLFLAALGLVLKKFARLHESVPLISSWAVPMFLLVAYAYLSLFWWAPYHDFGVVTLYIVIINFILYFYVVKVINSKRIHKQLMVCWVLAGVIESILVILSFYDMPERMLYTYKISDSVIYVYNNFTHVLYRGNALGHPNVASTVLNMTTCVNIGLILTVRTRWKSILLWGALILSLFGNFLTLSKAGLGSLVAMICFLLVVVARLRKRWFINMVVCLSGVAVIFLVAYVYFTNTVNRDKPFRLFTLSTPTSNEITSLKHRIIMWKAGLAQMSARHLTLLGLGPGGFEKTTEYPHSHSLYFSFFFDFGIAGVIFELILFIAIARYIWEHLRRYFTRQETYFQIMSLCFMGGLLALAIHSTVDQNYYKNVIWIFLGLAVSTFSLTKKEAIRKEKRLNAAE